MSTPETTPSLEILLQYMKDLSLENPAPQKFFHANQETCETRIEVDVAANPLDEDTHEVVVMLRIVILEAKETLYMLEMQFAALVKVAHASEEVLPLLLFIQCPALLFPYMRMLVSVLTQESGFPPLNLNPIDFAELFRQKVQHAQQSS